MRRAAVLAVLAVAGATLLACHTITEDLPSRPSPIQVSGPIPVIVVPVPAAPAVPSPSSPLVPSPQPRPTATPVGGGDSGGGGGGEPPVTNRSPVAKLNAHVYFIECDGAPVPGTGGSNRSPVGCRIHFNATPRDGSGAPTCSKTWPVWQVGPEDLVGGNGGETFTPAYTTKAPGVMSARCLVDGVRSGWIVLTITDR